jgi:uncharacterized membrane protein
MKLLTPSEFVKALVDDLTGADANGRTADEKKAYMAMLMGLLAIGAVAGLAVGGPLGALPCAVLLGIKAWIHLRNTY